MGLITGLFWLAVAVIFGLAAGWVFRVAVVAASPRPIAKELRTAPLTASFGMLVILIYILVAVFAPLVAPFPETEVVGSEYQPWDDVHVLGTDNLVGIAFITTALAFILGVMTGLLAASVGGWVDQVLSRAVDVLMAIPALIFALLLLTIVGTSIVNMILVIALIDSTRVFRLARAVAMNIVVMDYVEAARLRGEGLLRLHIREVLPNAITPLLPAGAIALLTVCVNFVVDWQLHRASGLKE